VGRRGALERPVGLSDVMTDEKGEEPVMERLRVVVLEVEARALRVRTDTRAVDMIIGTVWRGETSCKCEDEMEVVVRAQIGQQLVTDVREIRRGMDLDAGVTQSNQCRWEVRMDGARPEQRRGSSLFQPHAIGLLGFTLGNHGQAVNSVHVALIYHRCMHAIGMMDMRAWRKHASGSLGHAANAKQPSADPERMAGDALGHLPRSFNSVGARCIPYLNFGLVFRLCHSGLRGSSFTAATDIRR
jgi:hypothetical protein